MAKKDKLPKKIAGVKVPKKLRKSAVVMAELARNPIAREVVSAALVAGAAALARHKGKIKAAAEQPEPRNPGNDLGAMIAQGVAALVNGFNKPAEKRPGDEAGSPARPQKLGPKSAS